MKAVIVKLPVYGKWPVTSVFYEKGGQIKGWMWRQDGIEPADVRPFLKSLEDVQRYYTRLVSHSEIIDVPGEQEAKDLLGKE